MYIGEPFSWKLAAFEKLRTVHGRIVYINEHHRYFTAEAEVNGIRLR